MTKSPEWRSTNRLLGQLPDDVCDRIGPHMQRTALPAGKVLYESSVQQTQIYFPRQGVVSLLYVMDNGDTGEIAIDRAHADELQLTQEAISNLLGVRREAVSEAASRLQDARVISYSRGNIRLRDRPGLEARSCGCYQAVRDEQARMMKSLREL